MRCWRCLVLCNASMSFSLWRKNYWKEGARMHLGSGEVTPPPGVPPTEPGRHSLASPHSPLWASRSSQGSGGGAARPVHFRKSGQPWAALVSGQGTGSIWAMLGKGLVPAPPHIPASKTPETQTPTSASASLFPELCLAFPEAPSPRETQVQTGPGETTWRLLGAIYHPLA
jgi:hypothetical protein